MKAFLIDRYGGEDVVHAGEVAQPELRDDDVLVEVHAAGLNPLDLKIRAGKLKAVLPYRFPLILGNDVAGVVVRVGPRVRRFAPGDEIYARPDERRIGTLAEYIAIREDDVAHKPRTLTMEEAASVPLVGLTAWQAFLDRAGVQPGQKVLIHAGSGGVGTFAIQLAKHLGAVVATTAGEANREMVKDLGADVVIDYRNEDFETVLRDYDLVLDTQGGKTLDKSMRVLRRGGRVVSVAGVPDPDFASAAGLNPLVRLGIRLLSHRVRRRARRHGVGYSFLFMSADGEQLEQIAALIDSGTIRPVVDRVFPFESTPEALAYLATGRARGKVVVKVR